MKKILSFVTLVTIALAITSCCNISRSDDDKKTVEAKNYNFEGFNKINASGAITVYYVQDSVYSIKVKSEGDKLLHKLDMKVEEDSTLSIVYHVKNSGIHIGTIGKSDEVKVYVSSPDLIGVSLTGACDFKSKKSIDTDVLVVNTKGSCDLLINELICDRLSYTGAGAGDMTINKVKGDALDVTNAGACDLVLKNAEFENASFNLSGASDVTVKGTIKNFTKQLSGACDLKVNGKKYEGI